jgi:hypothetical protein
MVTSRNVSDGDQGESHATGGALRRKAKPGIDRRRARLFSGCAGKIPA